MRDDGVRFRRQYAIGPFITDFCAPRRKIVIEVDGSQHREQRNYYRERTDYLQSQGYSVLRFWNDEVMGNIDRVMLEIGAVLARQGWQDGGVRAKS